MSAFSEFMRDKKRGRSNVRYAPSQAFTDENGKALEWEFRPLPTKEFEQLKQDCTKIITQGKNPVAKCDAKKLAAELVVESTVYPDLYNTELQQSYGVAGAVDLLYAMIDNAGEYSDLVSFVNQLNGFTSFSDDVETAKN